MYVSVGIIWPAGGHLSGPENAQNRPFSGFPEMCKNGHFLGSGFGILGTARSRTDMKMVPRVTPVTE